MGITELLKVSEFKNALNSNCYVVIDFYANWCGPCKQLTPKLHEMSDKYSNKARFYKLDVDKLPEIADDDCCSVSSLPTVIIFKSGKEVQRVEGNDPERIDRLLDRM